MIGSGEIEGGTGGVLDVSVAVELCAVVEKCNTSSAVTAVKP